MKDSNSSLKPAIEYEDVLAARNRTATSLPITPLTHSPVLSETAGVDLYFKWDNKFKTGSFKERGVVNFLGQLSPAEKASGICTASAGNHAMALSYHAARFQIPCAVVMPRNAALVKIEHAESAGASVELFGSNLAEALERAKALSLERKMTLVPPYDDARIVAGQGTCGLEILEQLSAFDTLVVPVGGGGLIAGIATAVKAQRPDVFIIGVQSEWVRQFAQHKQTASDLFSPITIADGIAVKTLGALPSTVINEKVDELISIDDGAVAQAVIRFLEQERILVEGAGAAGLAAVLERRLPASSKRVVVVVSGSNIDINLLWRLIERDMHERGRLTRIHLSIPDSPGALHRTTGAIAELRANVLQAYHDRKFCRLPGRVEVTFVLEVRNSRHKQELLEHLRQIGLDAEEI